MSDSVNSFIYKLIIKSIVERITKIDEPEKTTGPSGVIPIAVLKEESNVKIPLLVFSFYH